LKKEEHDNDEEDFELFGNTKSAKKMPDGESSARRSAVGFLPLAGIYFIFSRYTACHSSLRDKSRPLCRHQKVRLLPGK
jgi:hypothetical protein